MMLLVHKFGLNVSHGAILAAIIGYSVSIILSLSVLNRKYKFSFKDTFKRIPSYILSWIVFVIVILLLKLIVPTNLNGRLIQIPILLVFGIISFGIYVIINYKNGNLKNLFDFRN